ncbi:hypothetical protein, partial [Leucobacter sp.]
MAEESQGRQSLQASVACGPQTEPPELHLAIPCTGVLALDLHVVPKLAFVAFPLRATWKVALFLIVKPW